MIKKELFDHVSAACSREVIHTYSTSFSLGIAFIGKELRQPIYDIYGFVRLADEIGEGETYGFEFFVQQKWWINCFM